MVIRTLSDCAFTLADLPAMPLPGRVLLTTPTHFEVCYVINPHMAGHVGGVNPAAAQLQWERLRQTYTDLGLAVHTLPGLPGLPDMVFCANQTLPALLPDGRRVVVASRMHAAERAAEVEPLVAFFERQGYAALPAPGPFEGMGDALWHPGRRLLWGGYGFRTEAAVYDALARTLGVDLVALALHDPDFYHLDTCLCLLDETTALYYPGAFDADGLALLERLIPRLIAAPEDEARRGFACNAHAPDGRHVLIHAGCPRTIALLEEAGFRPHPLDTGEFLKAGGSVFCMKMAYW